MTASAPATADLPSRHPGTWPDELVLLLGPDAGGLLAAVAAAAGGELSYWRPRQVDHKPGRFTVVQYRTTIARPDGGSSSETFVAATGERIPPQGAAVFDDGSTQVAVWRWPQDPFLPGLSAALDSSRVASLLDDLGVDGGTVRLHARAYRPARRAVVEATGRRGRLFLKVVRPDRARALHELHRLLAPHIPVPESLGWTDHGVVALSARPGLTVRQALRSSSHAIPSPQAVVDLLDRLPPELAEATPRRDLLSTAEYHAEVLAATVPGIRELTDPLLERLRSSIDPDSYELTAVHGDLYEAQLLVDRGRISGLLDVDTAGAGFRVDDLANFCAHLSVLELIADRPKRIRRFGGDLLAYAEHRFPPAQLRPRIAAVVLGLATGPFRVLETRWEANTRRRLELAGEWLEGIEPAD